MSTAQATLDDAARRITIVLDFLERIRKGGDAETVHNGVEDLPTIAKLIKDLSEQILATVGATISDFTLATEQVETKAALVEADRLLAQLARLAAELARDGAQLGSGIYTSTAAGLAATSNGQLFKERSANPAVKPNVAFTIHLNNAGVAEPIVEFPSKGFVDALRAKFPLVPGAAKVAFTDDEENILMEVTPELVSHPQIDALQARADQMRDFNPQTVPGASGMALVDEQDNLIFQVDGYGAQDVGQANKQARLSSAEASIAVLRRRSLGPTQGFDYSALVRLLHLIVNGQSLSVGAVGTPVLSVDPLSYAYRFVGGVVPHDDATDPAVIYASLVNLNETNRESIMSGAIQMIAQLLLDEDGIDITAITQRFLASAPGEGSRSIEELSSGALFDRFKANVTYGRLRADELGLSYGVGGVFWLQGEKNYNAGTGQASYEASLRALRLQMETHIQAVTGINRPLPLFTYQCATHLGASTPRVEPTVALAQLAVAQDPHVVLACPMHFLPYSDLVHLNNNGYKWCGSYFGLAAKRLIFDNVKLRPLQPLLGRRFGRSVVLPFEVRAGRRLVFDTARIPNPGRYGLDPVSGTGDLVEPLSISIVGTDRVEFWFASEAEAASVSSIRGGWRGPSARGLLNLRDDDPLIADPNGINAPMHTWAPIFEAGVA